MAVKAFFTLFSFLLAAHEKPALPGGRDFAAAAIVNTEFDRFRGANALPRLKLADADQEQIELTCTAALTGKDVREPKFGAFVTYTTSDLHGHPEPFLLMALGTSRFAGESYRRPVYIKGWPRYSIVVFRDFTSTLTNPVYRVGIERRQSLFAEITAPLTFDSPVRDSNDWKEQADPACRGEKTR